MVILCKKEGALTEDIKLDMLSNQNQSLSTKCLNTENMRDVKSLACFFLYSLLVHKVERNVLYFYTLSEPV